ncbi:MAG: transposase [Candidatus Aquirickettsiella gammari]
MALTLKYKIEFAPTTDAAWVKKGKKSHYGYRSYVTVEETEGYVRGVHTAPANESETTHFIPAIDKAHIAPTRVYADKGYASAKNRNHLRQAKIKSAIMHKGQRNKPLSKRIVPLGTKRQSVLFLCWQT